MLTEVERIARTLASLGICPACWANAGAEVHPRREGRLWVCACGARWPAESEVDA